MDNRWPVSIYLTCRAEQHTNQGNEAMARKQKNYRVSSANCVLNYYDTESSACEYIAQLEEHSPSIARECVVERRDHEEPTEWNEVKGIIFSFCGVDFILDTRVE